VAQQSLYRPARKGRLCSKVCRTWAGLGSL